jgi:5-methylcytosine-specific restriction endonuclease McrA
MTSEWMPSFYRTKKWYALRLKTLKRDHYICAYCGDKATTADHVIPRGKGGSDTLDNLVAACVRCNKLVAGRMFPSLVKKKKWLTRAIKFAPPTFGQKKISKNGKRKGMSKSIPTPKSTKKKTLPKST